MRGSISRGTSPCLADLSAIALAAAEASAEAGLNAPSKKAFTLSSISLRGITCRAVAMVRPFALIMSPASGLRPPVMSWKMVLFPAPFWPMSVIFAPSRTEKTASFKMCLLPYANETLLKRMITSPFILLLRLNLVQDFFDRFDGLRVFDRERDNVRVNFLEYFQFLFKFFGSHEVGFRKEYALRLCDKFFIPRSEFCTDGFIVREGIGGFRGDKVEEEMRAFDVAEEF